MAEPPVLLDVDQARDVIGELHHWLLERRFPALERYPWPGDATSLYDEPMILLRHLAGASNCWRRSACWRLYDRRLRRAAPELHTVAQALLRCEPVGIGRLRRVLGEARCDRLRQAGAIEAMGGSYRSRLRATPWAGGILWHDGPPAFREGFVFLGPDSLAFARHLAGWLARHPGRVRRALDLCTGSGIHALMLSRVADDVVGSDINARAVTYARLNAWLRGVAHARFVVSDLFADITGGPFDVIVSNTPFLFLPQELRSRCVDGDGGAMGIELVLRLVEGLPQRLTAHGVAMVHANSPIVSGRDLLAEELRARLRGEPWEVTLTPTHEFYDADFGPLYAAHGIQRFVTYVVVLRRAGAFRMRRRALSPWRRAACAARIAAVRLMAGRSR